MHIKASNDNHDPEPWAVERTKLVVAREKQFRVLATKASEVSDAALSGGGGLHTTTYIMWPTWGVSFQIILITFEEVWYIIDWWGSICWLKWKKGILLFQSFQFYVLLLSTLVCQPQQSWFGFFCCFKNGPILPPPPELWRLGGKIEDNMRAVGMAGRGTDFDPLLRVSTKTASLWRSTLVRGAG